MERMKPDRETLARWLYDKYVDRNFGWEYEDEGTRDWWRNEADELLGIFARRATEPTIRG